MKAAYCAGVSPTGWAVSPRRRWVASGLRMALPQASARCAHAGGIQPGSLQIVWQPAAPRVLGLFHIPRLRVRFAFAGLDDGQRYAFMKRFDLYMQRGGG